MTTSEFPPNASPPVARPVDVAGLSHTGSVRESNEDHFLVAAMRRSVEVRDSNLPAPQLPARFATATGYLMVVADGVGGMSGGALASSSAVATTLEYVSQAAGCFQRFDVATEDAFLLQMEAGIREAHETLRRDFGDSDRTPATTLTMAVLVAPRAYVVHVGDSRAYYYHAGVVRQLTRDQTLGQYMLDAGALTEEQVARVATARHLSSAVGGPELTPAVGVIDLEPGDILLLCTDGLTHHVTDAEMGEVLQHAADAHAACAALVDLALKRGGSDNITVVVARLLA